MIALLAAAVLNPPTKINLEVVYLPIANLTYQLDIVSGVVTHEPVANFRALWQEQFLASERDRAMVRQWAENRAVPQAAGETSTVEWPFENALQTGSADDEVRAAGFDATSASDYRARIVKLLPKAQAGQLAAVVGHFDARFLAWWKRDAERAGEPFSRQLRDELRSPEVRSTVGQLTKFYRPKLENGFRLPFVLFFRPDFGIAEPSTGQQLHRHSLVQFARGESARSRLDVVLHEFCHFLYYRGDPGVHLKFQQQLERAAGQDGVPAFGLLDEGLATAFGNGMVAEWANPERFGRTRDRVGGWYNNPDIDKTGKAIFPWLKTFLADGISMDDPEFADQYVATVRRVFGDDLRAPRRYLKSLLLILPPSMDKSILGSVRQKLGVAGMYTFQEPLGGETNFPKFYRQLPAYGALVIVSRPNVSALSAILKEDDVAALAKSDGEGVVLGVWNGRRAPTFVIVADGPPAVESALDRIAKLVKVPDGVSQG